jgi:hypothetical protein
VLATQHIRYQVCARIDLVVIPCRKAQEQAAIGDPAGKEM